MIGLNVRKKAFALLFIFILFSCFCKKDSTPAPDGHSSDATQIILLYTNDEHGWMEATGSHGGAAGMMGLWRQEENYTEDGPFLILSGGDMWTGPAISTWFKGESMIEVLNAMNYSAAAIGNHEFDFQVTELNARLEQAAFPFLSANIRLKSTGEIPGFATPFIITEVNGVQVGLIGLSSISTPTTTFPDYVRDYDFISYEVALEEFAPRARDAGAELLIVIGHLCQREMEDLAFTAAELGIPVIGGGHCHETVRTVSNGVTIFASGSNMENYARVDIWFNRETGLVESVEKNVYGNRDGTPDEAVASVVAKWKERVDDQLSEVIGYVERSIGRDSPAMYNMIVDSWLVAFPAADVSISNTGGVRQSIPAGDITLAEIVGVLPFENTIYQLELTGEQLKTCIDDSLFVGGMTRIGGYFLADGSPLEDEAVYNVLITDYIYSSYDKFKRFDSSPIGTGVHWRRPVIDWIKSLNTSPENPLDQYLDDTSRQ